MKQIIKLVIILSGLFLVLSCTPTAPYEIKSPCVSNDLDSHPYGITPCPRRPANSLINYAIV